MTAVDDLTSGETSRPHLPSAPELDLDELRARLGHAAGVVDEASSGAELVDRMARLARLRCTVEAVQAATEYAFARVHAGEQIAAGVVDPDRLERSIGTQIGLANRVSPTVGRNRMRTARDVHSGFDHARALSAGGRLDGYRVSILTTATAHLGRSERTEVDRRLAQHTPGIDELSVGRLRDLVQKLAAEVAPDKFRDRCATARTGRRVTIRQGADGMVDLRAHLPVEQGVACYAALHKAYHEAQADPEPLTRGRGQVMADTLVERITGQVTAEHVKVEVQVTVPLGALLEEGSPLPGEIAGFGPVPVEMLSRSRGRRTLRRLITEAGIVIGGDSQSRCFPTGLGDLIRARDRARCTEPYCDAPARHNDHIVRSADGGPTAFADGRAVCEMHNYLREQPGWRVEPAKSGTCTTTPTGHRYLSRTG